MKATEQYFPAVLSIILYQVVLTCKSVHEILQCADLYESYLAAVHAVYYSFQGGCNFLCLWMKF